MCCNLLKNKKNIFLIIAVILIMTAIIFLWHSQLANKSVYTADVIIENGIVITMDSSSDVFNPGYVVVQNSKIIAVGQGQPKGYLAKKNIDARGQIVLPGLVNTHSHAAIALLNGLVPNQPLKSWLVAVSEYEKRLTPEDIYWGSLLAEDKMIKNGITTFNDMYFFPEQTLAAVKNAGLRAILRISATDDNGQIIFNDQIAEQNRDNPLVTFSVAPNPLLNYSLSEFKQFSNYASAKKYLVHIHFEEDKQARSDALLKYNFTPLQLIAQAGFLENKTVLAHAVDLTDDEINQLAKYPNIGVSFNPISEFNLKTSLTPVSAIINQNITVGFGTDGELGSSLDMFDQIKFAAEGHLDCRATERFCQNGSNIDSEKIIRMATIDGAKILGLEQNIGSLEIGKQADIIIIKAKSLTGNDVYSTLVYNTKGEDVTETMVGGKLLMENGKILTIDENKLVTNTHKIIEKISSLNN